MYIIYETVASTDPRTDSRIQIISSEWHFTIGYIAPEHEGAVNTQWLNATTITEGMAHAHNFTNAIDGEVPIMRNVSNPRDIVQPTSFGDSNYEKINYALTSTDELNTVGLLKAIMLNFAEHHFTEETGLVQIKSQVPGLQTLKDTQMYFATYFEWECAYTANKDKTPQFGTTTFSETLIP
jgi:hypothetical protein